MSFSPEHVIVVNHRDGETLLERQKPENLLEWLKEYTLGTALGEKRAGRTPIMKWLRLYITVEGPTEKEFADLALKPHLAGYKIEVRPRVVITNRKLGKRGGILDFERIKGDLERLMKQDRHPEARFTTMLDLYALPTQFPGWTEARKKTTPADRNHSFGTCLCR